MILRVLALFAYCALLFFAAVSWTLGTLTIVPPWMGFIVHPVAVLVLVGLGFAIIADAAHHPDIAITLFAAGARLIAALKIAGFALLAALVTVVPLWWKGAVPDMPRNEASARLFIPGNIDAKYLVALYQYNPSADADKMAADFIGRWMRVNSAIDSMENRSDQRMLVFANGITMAFGPHWIGPLSLYHANSRISAVGKIDYIDKLGVHLSECELADPNHN